MRRWGTIITIVGTIHILDLNAHLERILHNVKPDVICLELDDERYNFIETILTKYSSFHAKTDMPCAISYAKTHNIPIELIDKPGSGKILHQPENPPFKKRINTSCKKIFTLIAFLVLPYAFIFYRCKKFVNALNKALYTDKQRNSDLYTKEEIDFYNALMTDREVYMVNKLQSLSQQYQNIVAIVGDAHLPGINALFMKSNSPVHLLPFREYFNEQLTVRSFIDFQTYRVIFDFVVRIFLFVFWFFLLTRVFF